MKNKSFEVMKYIVETKLNIDFCINFVLVLIYIFSDYFLEEDLIINICSNLILFFVFFVVRELKNEKIRQFRLQIKKIYRRQNDLLFMYYFYYNVIIVIHFRYLIRSTILFFFKSTKFQLVMGKKIIFPLARSIYIKTYYFNLILKFFRKICTNFLKFSINQ